MSMDIDVIVREVGLRDGLQMALGDRLHAFAAEWTLEDCWAYLLLLFGRCLQHLLHPVCHRKKD